MRLRAEKAARLPRRGSLFYVMLRIALLNRSRPSGDIRRVGGMRGGGDRGKNRA